MIHWKKFLQNIPEKIIGIYAQDMVLYLTQLVRKEDGWQVGRSCCFSFAPDETADWNEQVMEQVKVICMKEHLSCRGEIRPVSAGGIGTQQTGGNFSIL